MDSFIIHWDTSFFLFQYEEQFFPDDWLDHTQVNKSEHETWFVDYYRWSVLLGFGQK